MNCPKCGITNKPAAVYCAGCGTKLSSPQQSTRSYSGGSPAPSLNKTQIVQGSPSQPNMPLREIVVGRASNCDIIINDGGVSSKHSIILTEDDDIFIEDLHSLNGTFVDGRKIQGKTRVNINSRVSLGNIPLSMNHPKIVQMANAYGGAGFFSASGVVSLKVNQTWTGKIMYFLMIILFFFPWVVIKGGTEMLSFTALDFAFNKSPIKSELMNKLDYGPLNTLFLVLFILLIGGLILNFVRNKITDKFNWSNILSLIIFIITIIYMFIVSSLDDLAKGWASIAHTFSAYMFIFICFVSIFEGLIEYYIRQNNRY